MVPGSTLIYGSSLMLGTRMPRDSRIAAREAAAMPFPREETTPPVTKTYLVIYLARVGTDKFTRMPDPPQTVVPLRQRAARAISVAPAVLVRRYRPLLRFDPHQVVVGIERHVAIDAVANFQVLRRPRRAVDEVVRVALARRIARAHAGLQQLLAGAGHQVDLAFEHVDEFVFQRVPMAQCRLAAGAERHQVDAELGQAAGVCQAPFRAITHPRLERPRIPRAANFGHSVGIERGKLEWGHRLPFIASARTSSVSSAL